MRKLAVLLCVLALLPLAACQAASAPTGPIIVYSDVDPTSAAALMAAFTEQTGVEVTLTWQTPAFIARTVGQEDDPCQLVLMSPDGLAQMEQLSDDGRLVRGIDTQGLPWQLCGEGYAGLGGRTWVLLSNTELVGDKIPDSIFDLNDYGPGTAGLPDPTDDPLYLAAILGNYDAVLAMAFAVETVQNGVTLSPSARSVADLVGSGRLALAVTTYEAAKSQADRGRPVVIRIPDQGEGEMGTVIVPHTVAMVRGRSENDPRVAQLAQWLTQADAENRMIEMGLVDLSVRQPLEQTGEPIRLVRQRVGETLAGAPALMSKLAQQLG